MANADNRIPKIMTVAEAAEYLGVSETTVRRLASTRQVTQYRTGIERGAIRFDPNDLLYDFNSTKKEMGISYGVFS